MGRRTNWKLSGKIILQTIFWHVVFQTFITHCYSQFTVKEISAGKLLLIQADYLTEVGRHTIMSIFMTHNEYLMYISNY